MFTFAGRKALIIGAGRNIGRTIALEFAGAASPDQFIRDKAAEYARGESGLPKRVVAPS
ncbi:MAG: hypothetical protein ACLPV8_12315 [Steroidobacteraceae bacterium]